ncbi:hypothetical protein N9L48_05070 [Psychrosphaera sp.]|nr:hypothetical protein [Psychrosphaera sp.]
MKFYKSIFLLSLFPSVVLATDVSHEKFAPTDKGVLMGKVKFTTKNCNINVSHIGSISKSGLMHNGVSFEIDGGKYSSDSLITSKSGDKCVYISENTLLLKS